MCTNTDSQLRRTQSNLKTLVVQLVKKLPHFMEAETASSYIQNPMWSQLKPVHSICHIFLTLILILSLPTRGPGSVVDMATAYGLDGPWIESRWERDFPHLSRLALRPTQPPVQWVPGLSRE